MLQGRERERGQIGELLDAAATGSGGALVVTGDPGAGKSALLDEIARGARDQRGMTVLRTDQQGSLAVTEHDGRLGAVSQR